MQRFQVPYNLKAIPEVQEYLNVAFENSRHHGDLQDLYRRRYVTYDFIPFRKLKRCCEVYWSNLDSLLIRRPPEMYDSFSTGPLVLSLNQPPHRHDWIHQDVLWITHSLSFLNFFSSSSSLSSSSSSPKPPSSSSSSEAYGDREGDRDTVKPPM